MTDAGRTVRLGSPGRAFLVALVLALTGIWVFLVGLGVVSPADVVALVDAPITGLWQLLSR